jgi:hypothetical protein
MICLHSSRLNFYCNKKHELTSSTFLLSYDSSLPSAFFAQGIGAWFLGTIGELEFGCGVVAP